MKRTNKHVKETAKSVQQAAFKTPAQELQEFKARVLGMRYGPFIWLDLDACPVWEWTEKLRAIVSDEECLTAYPEVLRKSVELWPEYERLLERDPDALKFYKERYDQNRVLHKVSRDIRDLKGPGAPRKQAARDARIAHMKDNQGLSFGQIARKLGIGRQVATSAYYRMKKQTPRGIE